MAVLKKILVFLDVPWNLIMWLVVGIAYISQIVWLGRNSGWLKETSDFFLH